jgi:hypothetical protein
MRCQAFKVNGDQCLADAKYVIIDKCQYYCGKHIMPEYNFRHNTNYKLVDISKINNITKIQMNTLIQTPIINQDVVVQHNIHDQINNKIIEFIKNEFNINCIILDKINKLNKERLYIFKLNKLIGNNTKYIIKIISDTDYMENIYLEYCVYQKLMNNIDDTDKSKFVQIVSCNNKLMYHRNFGHWAFIVYEMYGKTIPNHILDNHSEGKDSSISQNIIEQMFEIIKYSHIKFIIHPELTPSKFLIDNDIVKLANLANSTLWADIFNDAIPQKDLSETTAKFTNHELITFCSYNFNQKKTTSRIDDFESLLYITMYLKQIPLPWGNLTSNAQIRESKFAFITKPPDHLNLNILNIIKVLQDTHFQQRPNYNLLKKLFLEI